MSIRTIFYVIAFPIVVCSGQGVSESDNSCTTPNSYEDVRTGASLGESLLQRNLGEPSFVKALSPTETVSIPIVTEHRSTGLLSLGTTRRTMPKLIRSMADKTTLFYHVHVPKTGGTTVANLLLVDICVPDSEEIKLVGWEAHCGKTCEMGLTDNELSCSNEDRNDVEHNLFDVNLQRADALKQTTGAENIVFVTTIRPGSERVISQWVQEAKGGAFIPPDGVAPLSSESLESYISGTGSGKGWISSNNYLARNNLAVAMLASADTARSGAITREHLEQAKQVLMKGSWLIGFTRCLDKLHDRLMQYATKLYGGQRVISTKGLVPRPEDSVKNDPIDISPEVRAALDAASSLDNELFDWAWEQAQTSGDERWAGTC